MHTDETIRTFIAIKISSELEKAFKNLLKELKKICCNVKWVNPESIHLTLKFLGNLTKSNIKEVFKGTKEAIRDFSSFQIKTKESGAFPSIKKPRVFWVGLEADNQTLIQLQNKIDDELFRLGFEKDPRRFHPHLTVGRVGSPKNIEEVIQKFVEYPFPEIRFKVDQILIMKSELTPKGALYSIQNAISLK
jgi:2'-5' RNA ligase